ncbi:MAG TPA: hypothetical protein VMM60_03590 [Ilumatobacter sp.]|nr:hypothetical protein [Ilumatobacter sp.]
MADDGRADVYAAEVAAFEGTTFEEITPLDELVQLASQLCAAGWWPHGHIAVVGARSDASSSSTRQHGGGPPVVRLAAPQMTPATLVHELAHVLAGVSAGHGPLFRQAYVDLASAAFGAEPSSWLAAQFDSFGLGRAQRRWEVPPADDDPPRVIAL